MDVISGSIAIRRNGPMELGQACDNLPHIFDHTTICFVGALRIDWRWSDGTVGTTVIKSPRPGYEGPSHFLVHKHVAHVITALEPNSIFWCVYSHRDESGRTVEYFQGNENAYGTTSGHVDKWIWK